MDRAGVPMAALGRVATQRRRQLPDGSDAPGAPAPTGRRVVRAGQEWLVHTRHVLADPASVWSALTRPEQLAQWIGTWQRLPDRSVEFRPSFEGDDVLGAVYRVDDCTAGRSFSVSMPEGDGTAPAQDPAHVSVELTAAGVGASAGTLLTLAHSVGNRALAPHLATGCEYYLDRLVRLLEGGGVGDPAEPPGADFDEYFVRQAAHYRRLFPTQRSLGGGFPFRRRGQG